jgi:hypothetical protein
MTHLQNKMDAVDGGLTSLDEPKIGRDTAMGRSIDSIYGFVDLLFKSYLLEKTIGFSEQ